ncbi:thioredoxin family protein [Mycoplasmatota bacterium zrk1]
MKSRSCAVCNVINDRLKNLLERYNLKLIQIYVEDFRSFSGQYLVFTVPTVLLFNKDKEVLRESRFVNLDKVEKVLLDYLDK